MKFSSIPRLMTTGLDEEEEELFDKKNSKIGNTPLKLKDKKRKQKQQIYMFQLQIVEMKLKIIK